MPKRCAMSPATVRDFGLNVKNVTEGRFGGTKSVVNFLITDKVAAPLHARGVQLIIATSHIAPKWALGGSGAWQVWHQGCRSLAGT